MGQLSVWHWLVVAVMAVLLFGLGRLPDLARALGRSLRIVRAEARGIETDGGTNVVEGTATAAGEPPAGPESGTPGGARSPGSPAGPGGAARRARDE